MFAALLITTAALGQCASGTCYAGSGLALGRGAYREVYPLGGTFTPVAGLSYSAPVYSSGYSGPYSAPYPGRVYSYAQGQAPAPAAALQAPGKNPPAQLQQAAPQAAPQSEPGVIVSEIGPPRVIYSVPVGRPMRVYDAFPLALPPEEIVIQGPALRLQAPRLVAPPVRERAPLQRGIPERWKVKTKTKYVAGRF